MDLFKLPLGVCEAKQATARTEPLCEACFRVLREYQLGGKEPGAHKWESDTRRHRPELCGHIMVMWRIVTGLEDEIFPWHDDYVMDVFVACRKLSKPMKREVCEALGLTVPGVWAGDFGARLIAD